MIRLTVLAVVFQDVPDLPRFQLHGVAAHINSDSVVNPLRVALADDPKIHGIAILGGSVFHFCDKLQNLPAEPRAVCLH